MSCFPEPYTRSTNKIKVELDLAYYAAKSYLKNATCGDTSEYAKTTDLARLKSGVYKLSDAVVNVVFKKTKYDEFVQKD